MPHDLADKAENGDGGKYFRLVNAAIMRTRTLRRPATMNAAASGTSLPLLRAEGAKRAAMMTTTHAVTAHSSVDIAMRTGERRAAASRSFCYAPVPGS